MPVTAFVAPFAFSLLDSAPGDPAAIGAGDLFGGGLRDSLDPRLAKTL